MRTLLLTCLTLPLTLAAAETPRAFPLWDGKETVETYAARVNLPATKSIDLGGGVSLDLVLIPAGQFIMGSPEPAKPTVTVAEAAWLIWLGGGAAAVLLLVLSIKCFRKRKLTFSLRWLLLLTIAAGVCVGGIARRSLALKEAARYETELAQYNTPWNSEKPTHSVTLTQPFYMGKYTVTQEQYKVLMGKNPSHFKGAQLPVECVTCEDAMTFYTILNIRMQNKKFDARLPTEAQWEYACRAGTQTSVYSGEREGDLDAIAWTKSNSGNMPHPVGEKKANAFGLYDMHGNVYQWCEDRFDQNYHSNLPPHDPKFWPRHAKCIFRGSYWDTDPLDCRAAGRGYTTPHTAIVGEGFRIILNITP